MYQYRRLFSHKVTTRRLFGPQHPTLTPGAGSKTEVGRSIYRDRKPSQHVTGGRTTADGLILQDLLDSFNLTQLCSQPSHLDNDGLPRSLLDLAITNRPDVFKSITVHPPLGTSDHLPISLESDFCFKPAPYQPHANSPVWLFHCKSEDRMQDAFDELEWESVFRNNDIDELWHQWCKKFFEDVSKFIPKAVPLSRKKNKRHQPWFTAFLRSQNCPEKPHVPTGYEIQINPTLPRVSRNPE